MIKIKKNRGSTTVMLIAFIVSTLLTSILGARQVERLTTTPTWVAGGNMSVGQVITAGMLKQERVSSDSNAVVDPRQLVGKILRNAKAKDEPFYQGDLSKSQKTWLADLVPEGRVLYTLTPKDGAIPHTQLRNGDRIDVLVKGRYGVRTVARDVLLMGALNNRNASAATQKGRSSITALAKSPTKANQAGATALVIAVAPQDVYPLASIGERESVSLVLHGQTEVSRGDLLEIDPAVTSRRQVEVFDGLSRRQVTVRN